MIEEEMDVNTSRKLLEEEDMPSTVGYSPCEK